MTKEELTRYLSEVENKVYNTPKNATSQRKLKKIYSFSGLPARTQLMVWDYIWNNTTNFWTRIQAFLFLESKMNDRQFLTDSWEAIKNWQSGVDHWGLSDALSKIYTKILELIPEKVLPQLKYWNKSVNLWDRRQSLISLLYFSRSKKTVLPFDKIIYLVNELIGDPEYYVQKAVGWSLKELYNVYPDKTIQYLKNKSSSISSTAFTIAIEKLSMKERERLKKLR